MKNNRIAKWLRVAAATITTAAIAVVMWGYFTICSGNLHGIC